MFYLLNSASIFFILFTISTNLKKTILPNEALVQNGSFSWSKTWQKLSYYPCFIKIWGYFQTTLKRKAPLKHIFKQTLVLFDCVFCLMLFYFTRFIHNKLLSSEQFHQQRLEKDMVGIFCFLHHNFIFSFWSTIATVVLAHSAFHTLPVYPFYWKNCVLRAESM